MTYFTSSRTNLEFKRNRLTGRGLLLYILLWTTLFRCCGGSFNVYLTEAEVRRLLGLSAELFYVREGVVNQQALNYVLPIPAHLNELHFTWQSLVGRPLPYSLQVKSNDPEVLATPSLNISARDVILSSAPQTFKVSLLCTRARDAEVEVILAANVTLLENNVTSLLFHGQKVCLENTDGPHVIPKSPDPSTSNILYIVVGCACVIIPVLGILGAACYMRNNKTPREERSASQNASNVNNQEQAPFVAPATSNSNLPTTGAPGVAYEGLMRLPAYNLVDSKDIHERIAELTIARNCVELHCVVLEGTFGRVYTGTCSGEDVIVKTVADHASQVQISLLLQEGMAMYGLEHENILSVLGVSIEDHTAPYLLYPDQEYTNLKKFLQKCREGVGRALTTQEVVRMALQVVEGVQFLHHQRLLHRDLATRNCVVDGSLRVRVADQALSRDLFPTDYHCLGDNENRPVKWLAAESLVRRSFSTASDVWAFGVLLWELTTLARQPYVEVDPFEMAAYLRDGYRLSQPINCPDELFAVMAYCWAMSPSDRPKISQLNICLQEFYTQLTRYV